MKITKRTRVYKVLPSLMFGERMDRILRDIPEYPLEKSIFNMTVGEFSEIVLDQERFINSLLKPQERAYIALGRVKTYKREMEQISNFFKKHQTPMDSESKQASIGIDFPNMLASILIDCTQFFHLPSLSAAEAIPLSEYLIILQYKTANYKFEKNYRRLQEQKIKRK